MRYLTNQEDDLVRIAAGEYFFNTDPGEGPAILAALDGEYNSEAEELSPIEISAEGLANGIHQLGVRFMDNAGTWGPVQWKFDSFDPVKPLRILL